MGAADFRRVCGVEQEGSRAHDMLGLAPASASAVTMISRQRLAWP
jgi:hypothetical protein